ncbi:beta-galactosidase GalB [Bacteroidota bacterium]
MKDYSGLSIMCILSGVFLILSSCNRNLDQNARITNSFNEDWKFILDTIDYTQPGIDDSSWRILNLPHDWSIEGEFNPKHPATTGGGALPGGTGWYRKEFQIPETDKNKLIFIHFDGIYWNSEVYLNGTLLGKRPNGYISFYYDMTPYVHYGDEANVLAVKVDNSNQPNSRWYSGSGIYRNVWITKTAPVYIDFHTTYITTPDVSSKKALVHVQSLLANSTENTLETDVRLTIYDPKGNAVAEETLDYTMHKQSEQQISGTLSVTDPEIWSVETPALYSLKIEVWEDGRVVDDERTRFGIRTFNFDSEKGFFLNGEAMKILGVCNHHDLGALGAAVSRRALERQLEILKEMGCNAIRTAHNPPAPELLDLCDEMGFLVMNETFDMWKKRKSRYDYSQYWDEWHVRDLTDHIKRDRNHPSVILWSIGNEILEQWDTSGIEMTRELYNIVWELDSTREIVTGNNHPYPDNNLLKPDLMRIIGYNYKHEDFERHPEVFPGKCFIATETTSGLMSRGVYDMPSDSIRRWPKRWDIPFNGGREDQLVSAYDNVSAPWGSTHEETWKVMKKHDYLAGMFIWTGFDYLGEPTPYGWPSRSSYFGIIDLAGFPKDVYYMYKSEWTDEPVLHVFPHWNWEKGQDVDVLAYTNCTEVELFLNGESMGVQENADSLLHLTWNLEFEPGELTAVGVLPSGEKIERIVRTAGRPAKIIAKADRKEMEAGGEDLSFITIKVVDENGTIVPDADDLITCEIAGNASIAAVDNGSQISHEPFRSNYRKAFNGKCLFIVRSGKEQGKATLRFEAEGLEGVEVSLKIR